MSWFESTGWTMLRGRPSAKVRRMGKYRDAYDMLIGESAVLVFLTLQAYAHIFY